MKQERTMIKKFTKLLEKEGILYLAEELAKKFRESEIYLVGGAVRDIILGRPVHPVKSPDKSGVPEGQFNRVKDIDIMARGVKIADLEKFLSQLGKVNLVGKRFGVLKFISKEAPRRSLSCTAIRGSGNNSIDIALPRTDFSFGTGGYKDVKTKSNPNLSVEDDLSRRDFTINAMAYDIYNNRLVDPFGGLADLKKKIIRAVGEPEERFAEDYSRMLRAIRFAMQLDFKIEPKTWGAIKNNIKKINETDEKGERKVPYEVIASEFLKGLDARPAETIRKYFECGAVHALMPELIAMKKCSQPKEFHSEGDVMTHTLMALDNIETKFFKKYFFEAVSLDTKVAILLHDVGKPATKKKIDGRWRFLNHDKIGAELARKFLERLKFSAPPEARVDIGKISWLVGNHMLFLYSDPRILNKITIEKYLFHKVYGGLSHMQLFLTDALACRPANVKLDLSRFKAAYKIWKEMGKSPKATLPAPILNGDKVMKILKIAPGPKVGEVLQLLREEQLNNRVKNKKEAEKFIKRIKE